MLDGVCTEQARCDVAPYAALVALTMRVVSDPRWTGRQPILHQGCPPGIDGSSLGRHIRYADRAPFCVVPHELAHLLSGEQAHGPRWRRAFYEIIPLLAPP